jgi:hypothetical protein
VDDSDEADHERNIATTRKDWEALAPFASRSVYVNDLGADEAERVRDVYGSTSR